jgi:hypothetical protein
MPLHPSLIWLGAARELDDRLDVLDAALPIRHSGMNHAVLGTKLRGNVEGAAAYDLIKEPPNNRLVLLDLHAICLLSWHSLSRHASGRTTLRKTAGKCRDPRAFAADRRGLAHCGEARDDAVWPTTSDRHRARRAEAERPIRCGVEMSRYPPDLGAGQRI